MNFQNAVRGVAAAAGLAALSLAPLPAVAGISVSGFDPGTPVVDRLPIAGTDDFIRTNSQPPLTNPFTVNGSPLCCWGVYGGQLSGAAGLYRIEVFGSEAAFNNTLEWNDGTGWTTLYTTPGNTSGGGDFVAPLVAKLVVEVVNDGTVFANGILPFRFGIGSATPPVTFVTNGSNPDDPRRPSGSGGTASPANFVLFTDPGSSSQPGSSPFWFVNFDDGNAVDDDDDDLNFRITKIPTPGAILLFGVGLVGLGLTRRRRAIAA